MSCFVSRYQSGISAGELLRAFFRLLAGRNYSGEITQEFEMEFAKKIGAQHAIAVSSVRFALYHTIQALELPAGSEVLCTPVTIYPIIETLLLAGLKPVFVDIQPDDFTMDVEAAEGKLTPLTKVLLATHLFGIPCDMGAVCGFASRNGLTVLEDASQCLNGSCGGKMTGAWGMAGFFSLGVTKTVNAYRGAVMTTDDDTIAAALHGATDKLPPPSRLTLLKWILAEAAVNIVFRRSVFSWFVAPVLSLAKRFGFNDRIDNSQLAASRLVSEFPDSLLVSFSEIQASTAVRMLAQIDRDDARRRRIAAIYHSYAAWYPFIELPQAAPGGIPNYWMFAVFCDNPDELKEYLWIRHKIDAARPSLDACHELKCFAQYSVALPVASRLLQTSLYLPLYPSLSDKEAYRVAEALKEYGVRKRA